MPVPALHGRLAYERHFHSAGMSDIAGVDEVGRGALAGPLVAAAVILPRLEVILADTEFWSLVHDSKTLSHPRRTVLAAGIKDRAREFAVASIPSTMIDQIGVGPANRMAMEFAVRALRVSPELLLIDAMTIESDLPQVGIIDGDARSLSIAAASIIAKVARDSTMCELDLEFPDFGFAAHKGYGVASHVAALRRVGPCVHHRYSFSPVRMAKENAHVNS